MCGGGSFAVHLIFYVVLCLFRVWFYMKMKWTWLNNLSFHNASEITACLAHFLTMQGLTV